MDTDKSSIASDFSVIPDSMVNVDETEMMAVPMGASFFRSEHSDDSRPSINSPFSKIKFTLIQRIGVDPSAPLSVIFSVTEDFSTKSSDRVALYKVGFSSSKDFLCYKWAPQPSTDDVPMPYTVLFEAKILPSDLEAYYQLCYLMQNGRIAGVSAPFQLKMAENLPVLDEVENAARNVLSIRIRELVAENESLKEQLKQLSDSNEYFRDLNTDLEEENSTRKEEISKLRKLIPELKEIYAEKDEEVEKLKMEIIEKENEMEEEKAVAREMQERLTDAVMNMGEMKETLSKSEEGKSISQERQQVLIQDNEDLKQTLAMVKEELETAMKERLAAEKIASDLSERLQTNYSESQMLALTNSKLVKKVKKLRGVITMMEGSSSDDWLCIDGVSEEKKEDKEEEEAEGDEDEQSEREEGVAGRAIAACMTCSGAPTVNSTCASSCSSQQQLSETVSSVKSNMEAIVTQLSKQTEEMRAIKRAVTRKNKEVGGATAMEYVVNVKEGGAASRREELSLSSNASVKEGGAASRREELSSSSNASDSLASSLSIDEEKKVLYGKTFLPANRTAPVFLPSKGTTPPPPALEKAPPVPPKRSGSLPPPQPTQRSDPSAPSMIQEAESSLPAPLLPETTPTARNAAVLKQFMDAAVDGVPQELQPQTAVRQEQPALSAAVRQEQQPQVAVRQEQPQVSQDQPPQAAVRQTPQESDDEDYHSTGDNGENTPSRRVEGTLKCPLCPLEFMPKAMRLMEEHINNHLDRTCPICSLVFQRSISQKTFENHVHSHFTERDEGRFSPSEDSSGPWDPRDTRRSFQLLEID